MHKELTDQQLETYARQIVLDDISHDGQLKLRNAKVCLVGVGGLGSPTALKLAGMGVGYLRLVDRDIVSRSDLHRQYLYDTDAIGRPKVEVAWEKLQRLNPDVTLDPVPEALNADNAEALIKGMDVVVDGLDRPEPRYIVNRTCHRLKVPYVFGAAIEVFGNVSTFLPGKTLCLECFMGGLKNEDLPVCGLVGVHPAVIGMVSSMQVFETVRLLTGQSPKLQNRLLYIDLRQFEFNILDMPALETCRVCGTRPAGAPEKIPDRRFEETCARDGRRNFVLTPHRRLDIDIKRLEEEIRHRGFKVTRSDRLGITFEKSPITACILKSGIMIAQTPPALKTDVKANVLQIYQSILVDGLGMTGDIVPEA